MHRLWESVVEPMLDAVNASLVVEIGADEGDHTQHLVAWCRRRNGRLHVVDPAPAFDPMAWQEANGDVGTLHLERSLNALARIGRADVVLVDGDHNHYTVLRELRLIAKQAAPGSGAFPLVLLHDVHWPYGRRDLYYDPEAIPPVYRKPFRRLGLRPDLAEPEIEGGFNEHLSNGLYENDLDNGVLTAVEDFIAETDDALRLVQLPGLHGLGVLVDVAAHPPGGPVASVLDRLVPTDEQRVHLEAIEDDRLRWLVRFHEERTARRSAQESYRVEKDRVAGLREELAEVRRVEGDRVAGLREELAEVRRVEGDRVAGLREELAEVRRVEGDRVAGLREEFAETRRASAEKADALRARLVEAESLLTEAQRELEDAREGEAAARREADERSVDAAEQRAAAEQQATLADGWHRRARWLEGELARIRGRKVVRAGLTAANGIGTVLRFGRTAGADRQPPPRPSASPTGGARAPRGEGVSVPERHGVASDPRQMVTEVGTATGTYPAHANIVIPVHDALDDVRRCLSSVAAHTNLHVHQLIIVDDGSGRETAAELRDAAARLGAQLIRREVAGGFSVAASAGIDASWLSAVVLLNSDTVVGPGWVDRMLACAQSDPRIGIVGPWSNAASWQSIPEVVDADGAWSTNPGVTPEDVPAINERLSLHGARVRPRVPLINGFCYLVTREVLDTIGSFDVASFPRGYGEEDDLSIRASEAGFVAAIADDCFVYHAKARSYSWSQRNETSRISQRRLIAKHGEDAITVRTREMRLGRDMVRARAHAAHLLADDLARSPIPGAGPSVAWLQPHLRPVGGIRRALEMSNRLVGAGWDVTLVSLDGDDDHEWLVRRAPAVKLAEAATRSFDVVLVSDPDVVWAMDSLAASQVVVYHLGAYHLYREHAVEEYYELARKSPNLANSRWTAAQVGGALGLSIDDVVPGGVDPYQFAPRPATVDHDVVCYGSRRPGKRTHLIEQAADGLRLGKLVELSASQGDLSWQYSRGRVFVSASSQEGFNLPCLEAMACGVPVVCTDDGGSSEYVVDGHNALVVDSDDPVQLREAIDRVLDDDALAARLIEGGLATAAHRDWDRVTAQLAEVLAR